MLKSNSVGGAGGVSARINFHSDISNAITDQAVLQELYPPYSDYSDYKPLNYDCLCLVHKSTYDIRYGKSPARFAAFSFLVVKAPITVDISLNLSLSLFLCVRVCVPSFLYFYRKRESLNVIKFILEFNMK